MITSFVTGLLNEGQLKIELFKVGLNVKEIIDYIKDEKINILKNVIHHISKLVVNLNINLTQINRLVSDALNIDIEEWLLKIEHQVSLLQRVQVTNRIDISLNILVENAQKKMEL